jgi:aryl-alcohol dehydrogenase-like predicted oxidoreductase
VAFLILLSRTEKQYISERLRYAQAILKDLEVFCRKNGVSPQELAIGYIKYRYPKSFVIFGAETAQQVQDNMVIWRLDFQNDLIWDVEDRYSNVEEDIVNPLRWKS